MENYLDEKLKEYGYNLSKEQQQQLENLTTLVIQKNQEINLTTIIDKKEFVIKHILDSLCGAKYILDNSKVLDIGSGAGFPALVLKIYNPTLDFVLVDSVRKKVDFLNFAIKQLSLKNVIAIHTRIEDFANKYGEYFDFCTSRAVAKVSTLIEYSLPFLRINGKIIAYKGPNLSCELNESKKALKILGGEIESVVDFEIEKNNRKILIVKKTQKTPKGYPRRNNKPRLNPIK